MPKAKETSNHPCHFLSLPSARRFWCRHCMSVFEDAITRWRHSRTCRYGVVDNFMRRRQLEAKALQNTTKPNPIEARLEQSVSPSAEPIIGESSAPTDIPSSSLVEKTNQGTSNDLFRCFICHNKFSSLEEMRHHVKYPCNNKKIVTDVPNPAMTVYIDEFTDRSRHWEPQPQQEEVMTSEMVSNIVSQETVHSTVEVNVSQGGEETIGSSSGEVITVPQSKPNSITPTNIYVNAQGETVIEVENLDLTAEGGELSLAHLLTQLSQQGIVFDKTKASQMEIHDESTTSDNETEEVYATETTYDPSARIQTIVKEEDDCKSTAVDAANTLAQLANFRGYRSQEAQGSIGDEVKREFIVEGAGGENYTYTENYTTPSSSNQLNIAGNELQPDFNVQYEYKYIPSDQQSGEASVIPQISLQSAILDQSSTQFQSANFNSVQVEKPFSSNIQRQIQPQMVTYISQPSTSGQHTSEIVTETGETMFIEDFVVQDATHVEGSSQHFHNVSTVPEGTITHANTIHNSTISAVLEGGQNSYIVIDPTDNSSQLICNQQDNQLVTAMESNTSVPTTLLGQEVVSEGNHQQNVRVEESGEHQQEYIQVSNEIQDVVKEDLKDNSDEFEVETVTLQEIVEKEVETFPKACDNLTPVEHLHIVDKNSDNDVKETTSNGSVNNFIQTIQGNEQQDGVPQQIVIGESGNVFTTDNNFTVSVANECYDQGNVITGDIPNEHSMPVESNNSHQPMETSVITTDDGEFTITVVDADNQPVKEEDVVNVMSSGQEIQSFPVYQADIQHDQFNNQIESLPSNQLETLATNPEHNVG